MTLFFVLIFLLILSELFKRNESFISGPCPNCGKRRKLDCMQCTDCGWCWTPEGNGECVPGGPKGPYFRSDCMGWQYNPHPMNDYRYFLPGWRRWWWWRLPRHQRDILRHRFSFRPPVVK